MDHDDNTVTVHPPFYIVAVHTPCYACGFVFEAVAIAATEHIDGHESTCFLTHATELPTQLVELVQTFYPHFDRTESHTLGDEYYGNCCPRCGRLNGDFYLHGPPDGVFCGTSEDSEVSAIVHKLSLEIPYEVEAGRVYETPRRFLSQE